uniref:Uncharacterized protein n=1 Tax=Candidatus Kentrum sp. UNK TaxID=2126344 RepID=A0A451AJ77_9GAMM|nr:MAG: hypothetical protein BECKUNK1418G_GA0071005_107910 [Candidatus Kentron sp. UNK]VFK70255.1 MAG: hypothetical protein BECKUNK1418H_GA0071006_102528 [Candidatus Kentron sp. UNK]
MGSVNVGWNRRGPIIRNISAYPAPYSTICATPRGNTLTLPPLYNVSDFVGWIATRTHREVEMVDVCNDPPYTLLEDGAPSL